MAILEQTRRRAEQLLQQLIDQRVAAHVRVRIRMSVETHGNNVTLKVARFRYESASERWTLLWSDRNGRWLRYKGKRPAANIATLIHEVYEDPFGAFWG